MADEDDDLRPGGSGDPAAVGLALNADRSTAAEARAYLREQTELARLQKQNLVEQNAFELSHLRFRRFADWGKFALQIGVGLILLLIVCGLGTMVWSAAQDRDLVVDAFSVPPDLAQSGMTGSILAARVLDRFGEMDSSTLTFAEGISAFHINNREEAHVEIPETGISIGELNRYLHGWLGHATHVTGELVRNGSRLSLTVRYGDQPGLTVSGAPEQLDGLIQKAAEDIFRAAVPLRFADYLSSRGRFTEAESIARDETYAGSNAHRSLAYVSLSLVEWFRGNAAAMTRDSDLALALDQGNLLAWYTKQSAWSSIAHDEDEWRTVKGALAAGKSGEAVENGSEMIRNLPTQFAADASALTGDYEDALAACMGIVGRRLGACAGGGLISANASSHKIEKARLLAGLNPALLSNGSANVDLIFSWTEIETDAGRWAEALAWAKKGEAASAADSTTTDLLLRPNEAVALAHSGDIAGAQALIAKTPLDCDLCVRARGKVATIMRDWAGAAHWFSLVSVRSPDIPFADADWGAMLMAKGDYAGAIAKFKLANAKGPHFADPLEMWGEALIRENRSDLALAKFVEADKYAPNWGRLHLKWGEALLWTGDRMRAKKEFGLAASLDLSVPDKAELEKIAHV